MVQAYAVGERLDFEFALPNRHRISFVFPIGGFFAYDFMSSGVPIGEIKRMRDPVAGGNVARLTQLCADLQQQLRGSVDCVLDVQVTINYTLPGGETDTAVADISCGTHGEIVGWSGFMYSLSGEELEILNQWGRGDTDGIAYEFSDLDAPTVLSWFLLKYPDLQLASPVALPTAPTFPTQEPTQ